MSLTADTNVTEIPVLPIQPVGDGVIVWCNATYRALDSKGIDYVVHDLTDHPDAIEELRNANFMQAPIVQFREDLWAGFRPDKIDAIAKAIA